MATVAIGLVAGSVVDSVVDLALSDAFFDEGRWLVLLSLVLWPPKMPRNPPPVEAPPPPPPPPPPVSFVFPLK